MKSKIERMKTTGIGIRGIAMVLFFVMLLTAIGSGSVLSAIAVEIGADDYGNAVQAAATEALGIAEDALAAPADTEAAASADDDASQPDLSGFEENEVVTRMKGDLAGTGAGVDLAGTGYSVYNENLYHINSNQWYNTYLQYWNSNNESWTSNGFQTCDSTHAPYVEILKTGSQDFNRFFVKGNTGEYGSGQISADVTSRKYTVGDGTTLYDLSTINGKARVVVMVSTNGTTYSNTANSNCIATVSGYYKTNDGQWNMTSTSSSTSGSNSYAEIQTIYSSTITYTASASGDYTFKGFSTTNSSSLPGSLKASGSTETANQYNNGNHAYYYAYFLKNPTCTATISSDGGSIGVEKSANASITTSNTTPGSATSVTTYNGTNVYVYTNQNSGYVPTVTVNSGAVSVTRDTKNKYHFTMPNGNATVSVTYAPATYKKVTVYSGTGGSVTVSGATTATIASGKNATLYIYDGDSITLTAAAATNYTFAKWKKNINNSYSTTNPLTETISDDTIYVASFSAQTESGWLYSGTDAASRTEVDPTSGLSTFPSNASYNAFRFMYGTTDTGLNTACTPEKMATPSTGGYPYWADITSEMNGTTGNFYIGLCNYQNKGNLVGNKSEEINDSSSNKTIKDGSNNVLFYIDLHENNDVTSSAKYILIRGVDWTKVSAISVLAYDNSKSTNSSNNHNNKVDYRIYYKAKASGGADSSYSPGVTYYAKDSSLNGTTDNPYFEADTTVTAVANKVTVDSTSGDMVSGKALKGEQITVSTTLSGYVQRATYANNTVTYSNTSEYAADKYYVAGYSFNGDTPQLLSPVAKNGSNQATYTCTYTIPENLSGEYLEITPIYWLKDSTNCTTFYVNGFEDLESKQPDWGNTLYIYPFYHVAGSTYNGKAANYSVYPGQPLIKNGGQIYGQIPLTDTGAAGGNTIKGVTINNGQNDSVHGSSTYCGFVSVHRQTYDYDDFYKIAKEKKFKADGTTKNLESIFFTFKYFAENTSKQHRLYSTTSTTTDGYESRYNDMLADTTRLTWSNTNRVTATELNSYASGSNGWEYLTDPLGNRVDIYGNEVTDPSAEPLKVVSMGYEYNNAGEYATEWAVFHKRDNTYYELIYDSTNSFSTGIAKNSSIVPSALVLNNSSRFNSTTWPQLDGDVSVVTYKKMYEALSSYVGVPVQICWEHEAIDSANSKAYRSDGRWNYTTVDNYVQSDIKIEYTNASGTTQYDTFDEGSHVGNTTGCSAYFTNEAYSGATVSTTQIISSAAGDAYTYTAAAKGHYKFVGWYRQDRTDTTGATRTTVTSALTGSTLRSTNSTFIAKFIYVGTGNMSISHTAAVNGTADTYVGVYLVNSSDAELATIANTTNTDTVDIGESFITEANKTAGNKLKIVLRTVPTGENTYSSYSCTRTDDSDASTTYTSSLNNWYDASLNPTTTATIYVPFNGGIFASDSSAQVTKALDYVSTMTSPTYKYNVKFHYNSRYFGEQAFTKSGTLNAAQAFGGTSTVIESGTSGNVDKTLKTSFLNSIKPYESNFNTSIDWNFNSGVTQYCTKNNATNTYTINAVVTNETDTPTTTRTGYFTVPYKLEADGKTATINTIADAEYGVLDDAENTYSISTTYDGYFKIGEETITAPKVLITADDVTGASADHKRLFHYWKIETTGDDHQGDIREIGRCYFPEFNYRAFDNYNITAVYGEENDPEGVTYASLYTDSTALSTSITYLGTTRNHWNTQNVDTSASATDTVGQGGASTAAGDILYNDFILSFKPEGSDLIKDIEGAEYGIIIQKLNQVQRNATTGMITTSIKAYEAANKSTEEDARAAAVLLATNGTKTAGFAQNKKQLNTNGNAANNKNRMHYVYSVNNNEGSGGNSTYLFRAYSYMKINGTVTVSAQPAYFYMRDEAIK